MAESTTITIDFKRDITTGAMLSSPETTTESETVSNVKEQQTGATLSSPETTTGAMLSSLETTTESETVSDIEVQQTGASAPPSHNTDQSDVTTGPPDTSTADIQTTTHTCKSFITVSV